MLFAVVVVQIDPLETLQWIFFCQRCEDLKRTRTAFNISAHYAYIEVRGAERSGGATQGATTRPRTAPQHIF